MADHVTFTELCSLLSKEGEKAVTDIGLTESTLKRFEENDILDLFKNFIDRFHARKFVVARKLGKTPTSNEVTSCAMESINNDDDVASASTSVTTTDLDSCVGFTADQLIEKKLQRGTQTEAQKYFCHLLRDAAESAGILKKGASISQLSPTRKTAFFDKVLQVAPQVAKKRREVFLRLAKLLQNRRKYAEDKEVGKRKSKSARPVLIPTTKSTCSKELSSQLVLGDHLYLLNKSKSLELGQGILVANDTEHFVEVVLKYVKKENFPKVHENELEHLNSCNLKTIVSWRKDRLSKTKPITQKSPGLIDARTASSLNAVEPMVSNTCTTTSSASTSDTSADGLLKLAQPVKKSRKSNYTPEPVLQETSADFRRNDDHEGLPQVASSHRSGLPKSKLKPNSQIRDNHIVADSSRKKVGKGTSNETQGFRKIVLMEWAKKELYFGVTKPVDFTNDVLVRNCVKPFAKLTGDQSKVLASFEDVFMISSSDFEVNPDMRYCVWRMPIHNNIVQHVPAGKYGALQVSDMKNFEARYKKKIDDYLCNL